MTSSSKVRFVSSIIAVRLPVSGTPAAAKRAGSTVTASVVISRDAEALGEALRGIDREAEDALAARAAATPSAAAVVVLPTPPAPTVMMTRRSARSFASPLLMN